MPNLVCRWWRRRLMNENDIHFGTIDLTPLECSGPFSSCLSLTFSPQSRHRTSENEPTATEKETDRTCFGGHTHTRARARTYPHTLTHVHTLITHTHAHHTLSLSHSYTHTLSHWHTHTHTPTQTPPPPHTNTHKHTDTPPTHPYTRTLHPRLPHTL